MQNACDAASLAAAQEITAAVYAAGQGQGSAKIDANSIAVTQATAMAQQVAAANGVYVDPASDVRFGKRVYDAARRTLAHSVGRHAVQRRASGGPAHAKRRLAARRPIAAGVRLVGGPVEGAADDLGHGVRRGPRPGDRARLLGLDERRQQLVDSNLSQSDRGRVARRHVERRCATPIRNGRARPRRSFPRTGFGQINSAMGTYVSSTDTATILSTLGLTTNVSGNRKYPYPQAGRNTDGSPKNKPSNSTSDALWTTTSTT